MNQLVPDKLPGIQVEGKISQLAMQVGGFRGNRAGVDGGDFVGLFKIGWDFADLARIEKLGIQGHYLYNASEENEGTEPYEHSLAFNAVYQQDRSAGLIELLYGDGYSERGDAYGITLMPAWFLYSDKIQLVLRYQFAMSPDEEGLRLQKRYEIEAPSLLETELYGDRYHAGYLGLNWYLYGRKLKIVSGVEYSHMDGIGGKEDFSGWTFFSGLRMYY